MARSRRRDSSSNKKSTKTSSTKWPSRSTTSASKNQDKPPRTITSPASSHPGSSTTAKCCDSTHTSNNMSLRADSKTTESGQSSSTITSPTKPSTSLKRRLKIQAFLREFSWRDRRCRKLSDSLPITTHGRIWTSQSTSISLKESSGSTTATPSPNSSTTTWKYLSTSHKPSPTIYSKHLPEPKTQKSTLQIPRSTSSTLRWSWEEDTPMMDSKSISTMIEKCSLSNYSGTMLLWKVVITTLLWTISWLMTLWRSKSSDSKTQAKTLSLSCSKDKNYPKKPSTLYIPEWVWRNRSSIRQLTSPLGSTSTFSAEIVLSMMLMTSPKPSTDINWESSSTLSKLRRERRDLSSIKFLPSTAMVLLKILWEVCSVCSPNHPRKIWLSCSPTTSTCSDSKPDWSPKTETSRIESLSSHSSAEMIPSRSTRTPTKTQAFGEESSSRGRNMSTKLKADT